MKSSHWNVDPTHSAIHFSVRHMVFAKVRGRFGSWKAALTLDPDDLAGSKVDVTIDAASIDTSVGDRDAHLRSADFLDVERFGEIRFRSTKVEQKSGSDLRVHGEITIRDTTRPITLDVELQGQAKDPWGNQRAAFAAKAALDRREFGLEWNQVLEAGGVLVGDRIDIEIELQAVSAQSAKVA